jgi:Cytochrome c554 and c-prime
MVRSASAIVGVVLLGAVARPSSSPGPQAPPASPASFAVGADCLACHNGLITPSGEDVSIGTAWQASMMAHSARDPYWQAAVRREIIDHPERAAEIQQECAACHMPMAVRTGPVDVFALAADATPAGRTDRAALARDGVSCTVCHQIQPDGLGAEATTNGRFRVLAGGDEPPIFGPHPIEPGLARVMHSSSRFRPAEGRHVQSSALCASCHTLTTHALGAGGAVVGTLPEQMPYAEWQRSVYAGGAGGSSRDARTCQDCHMPAVTEPTPIASVLGEPRPDLSRHTFVGANAFMLRMLDRHRDALGVEAPSPALADAARRAERLLTTATATIAIGLVGEEGDTVIADVTVSNLAGHKLPTGYPSRRVWIELTATDAAGRVVFSSGALSADGRIAGNDADASPTGIEPHHDEIARAEDVQIYEAAMVDTAGVATTGLLSGVRYAKDNRLLPRGFDPAGAPPEIAVHGAASADPTFTGGSDRVRYRIAGLGRVDRLARGPYRLEAVLRYQPIAWRWARNLAAYDAPETRRFVGFYEAAAAESATVLARASAAVDTD